LTFTQVFADFVNTSSIVLTLTMAIIGVLSAIFSRPSMFARAVIIVSNVVTFMRVYTRIQAAHIPFSAVDTSPSKRTAAFITKWLVKTNG